MKLIRWIILSLITALFITVATAAIFFRDYNKTKDKQRESVATSLQDNQPAGNTSSPPVLSAFDADTVPPYALADTQSHDKPVLFAPGIISTGDDDAHPTFTSDGGTVYFVKSTPQFNHWTLVISRFKDGKWSTPEVAPFSGRYKYGGVTFSPDGRKLFFASNRPGKKGGEPREDTDIWMMQKTSDGWGNPRRIEAISSPGFEWFPTLTNDGTIYFGSERRQGNLGPEGTTDLWRSHLVDGRYTKPENLGDVINTPGEDIEGYIAPDESFLIFSSKGRKDTRGSYDLYISFNQEGTWSEPQNLGDSVNSVGWEFGARLSPDGNYLFFTSNRSFFDRPLERRLTYKELIRKIRGPGNGLRDIYQIDADVLPLH